jgi:hypothetical protein
VTFKKHEAIGTVEEFLDDVVGPQKKRARKPRPLSTTQLRMLRNVHDGRDAFAHCHNMSEYGGADGTWRSLVRRGLLAWDENDLVITAAGREVLRNS